MNRQQIVQFVETHFTVVRSRSFGDELTFICPVPGCPDSTGNRSVNLKTGQTSCFRCSQGGRFDRFLRRLGYEVEKGTDIGATASDDILQLLNKKPEQALITPVLTNLSLPSGCVRLTDNLNSRYARVIENMAKSKNLSIDDMLEADVHFTWTNLTWCDYAIFPVYEWQKLVFYQGRALTDDPSVVQKRFPGKSDNNPFGARYWVYNIDALRNTGVRVAIVVESILNVLSLRKKIREVGAHDVVPIAVWKHSTSPTQLIKIAACSHLKELCWLYDADATSSSWKDALRYASGIRVSVAKMPKGLNNPTQDANDDVDLAWHVFENRLPVSASEVLKAQISS